MKGLERGLVEKSFQLPSHVMGHWNDGANSDGQVSERIKSGDDTEELAVGNGRSIGSQYVGREGTGSETDHIVLSSDWPSPVSDSMDQEWVYSFNGSSLSPRSTR